MGITVAHSHLASFEAPEGIAMWKLLNVLLGGTSLMGFPTCTILALGVDPLPQQMLCAAIGLLCLVVLVICGMPLFLRAGDPMQRQ